MIYKKLPKFNETDKQIYACIDDVGICRMSCTEEHPDFIKWLEEGNTPLPPDPEPVQEPLTAQQKLEASGLTVEELKELLGLS